MTARLAVLSIIAASAVAAALQSCQKDASPAVPSAAAFNPKAMILGFLQDVQDRRVSGHKSNEIFSLDSAAWYIEAGLNFTLGNLELAHQNAWSDTVIVPLAQTQDGISSSAVYDAFDALVASLAPWTDEEQHIVLVDVIDPAPGSCELTAVVQLGGDYSKAAPNTVYGPKDCYHYGGSLTVQTTTCPCGCSTHMNGGVSWCANKIIQNRINAANLIEIPDGAILTGVETWEIWNWNDIPNKRICLYNPILLQSGPFDGYQDTKPYSRWIYGMTGSEMAAALCLNPADMSYWTGNSTQGHWSAILAIKNSYTPFKTFIGCTIYPMFVSATGFACPGPVYSGLGVVYYHRAQYRYGQIVPG